MGRWGKMDCRIKNSFVIKFALRHALCALPNIDPFTGMGYLNL
jgi:hypothetical protein